MSALAECPYCAPDEPCAVCLGITAAAWDENKHPRHPAGTPTGGEFSATQGLRRTQAGDKLADRLIREVGPEGVRSLWDEDPRDSVAVALDLNNAPSQATIDRAKDAVRQDSREWALRQHPEGRLTVYRGGESRGDTYERLQSWTTHRETALFFAGKDPARVREREIEVGEIEAAYEALRGRGGPWTGFSEGEVLLRNPNLTAAAWDPVKHPRHPKGSEAGGEFAPKSTFVGLQGYERGPGKVVIEGERPRTPTSEVFAHQYQELDAAVSDWAHLRELDPDKELVPVSELVPTQDQMSAVRIQEYVTELQEDGNLHELLDSTRVVEGDDGRLYVADGHNRVAAAIELGHTELPLPVIRQAKAAPSMPSEFPPGEWTPGEKVTYWPHKIGAYSGFDQEAPHGPFWKALVDPSTGEELAFWFASPNGLPHHDAMQRALGEAPSPTGRFWFPYSGYGNTGETEYMVSRRDKNAEAAARDQSIVQSIKRANAATTAVENDVVRRHRRDIRDANEFLEPNQKDMALAAAAAPTEELTVEQFNDAVEAAAGSLDRFEPKLTRIYERAMKELGRQLAARFVRLAPDAVAAAAWDESKHPRDPGGEGGGQFIPKGTTAPGEPEKSEGHLLFADKWEYLVFGDDVLRAPIDNPIRVDVPIRNGARFEFPASQINSRMERGVYPFTQQQAFEVEKADVSAMHVDPELQGVWHEDGGELVYEADKPGLHETRGPGRPAKAMWKASRHTPTGEWKFWTVNTWGNPHHDTVESRVGWHWNATGRYSGAGNMSARDDDGTTPLNPDLQALLDRHARALRDAQELAEMHESMAAAAAPPDDWTPPTVAELLAVQEDILETAAAEARTVQVAAFEAMVDGVLRRIGISFEVRAILTQALLNGLGARAIEMIEGIRVPVARAIANSYLNGLSVPETADVIQEAVDGLTKTQATMLARNDLVGLANGGSLTSARLVREKFPQVGLAYKEWLATPDERTRPTHVEAHGQRVPLETPFAVGEAQLAYPGDPTGPDAEVINCRCTLIYRSEPALTASSVVEKIQELTAAFIESQHPRDPGGDKGGEFVKKGTTGVDEGEGETELREAEGATLQEMLDDMGAYELEGGQERHPERYMKHPKSGFMVEKPGTVYPEAVSPELDEDGWGRKPPRIRDVVASEAFKRPEGFTDEQALGYGKWQVGEARPPEYLFRAISEEEWEGIQRRGYMQTDGRMNLSEMEGTVTALSDPSYYLPGALSSDKAGTYEGRVIRIRYHDEDGWRHDRDGYVKTSSAVPIDRIDMVTPKLKREVTPRPGKDWNDIGPVVRASAAWDEAKHPRDPGGEGGGRWIPKGTTAPGAIDSDYNPEAVGATNRLGFYLLDEANALRQAAKAVGEYASVDVLLKEKVMRDLDVALAHDPDWEALSRKVNRLEMKDYSASPGENAAARLIASWATTSSDADPWALQLQLAAEQEFGLTDVSDYARKAWDAEKTGMMAFPLSEALRDPWVEHYVWNEQEMAGARKFLRAQYDATQKVLADADINTVALYRGVRDIGAAHGQSREKMTLNPLSSFSTRYDTAYAFAVSGMGAGEDWKDASLIAMNVPRERILSFPLTGFGSEMEQEAVVLGGTEEGFRWTWHKQLRRPPGEPLTLMDPQDVGRPPFDHSKYLQAWDKA